MNSDFSNTNKKKVFVIGDSFARDWANTLFESDYSDYIELRYTQELNNYKVDNKRFEDADYIFFSRLNKQDYKLIKSEYNIDDSKVYNIGTKSFGTNNGKIYAKRNTEEYFESRAVLEEEYLITNLELKDQWGDQYIDLITPIIDENNTVPVFNNDNNYISQDTRHLTQEGAKFYADILELEKFDFHK